MCRSYLATRQMLTVCCSVQCVMLIAWVTQFQPVSLNMKMLLTSFHFVHFSCLIFPCISSLRCCMLQCKCNVLLIWAMMWWYTEANWTFSFEVKFYPMDAASLREDYTRYSLCNPSLEFSFFLTILLNHKQGLILFWENIIHRLSCCHVLQ